MRSYQDLETSLDLGVCCQLGYWPATDETSEGGVDSSEMSAEDKAWVEGQQERASGSGWPGAVPIRPSRWDLDTDSYRIASGDTIAGLAATYLGSPTRWDEIWLIQPAEFRAGRTAATIWPDEWILMPPDAVATLLQAVGLPPDESGGTPAGPPPGGYVVTGGTGGGPGSVASAQSSQKTKKTALYVAGGIGAAALLYWALS